MQARTNGVKQVSIAPNGTLPSDTHPLPTLANGILEVVPYVVWVVTFPSQAHIRLNLIPVTATILLVNIQPIAITVCLVIHLIPIWAVCIVTLIVPAEIIFKAIEFVCLPFAVL